MSALLRHSRHIFKRGCNISYAENLPCRLLSSQQDDLYDVVVTGGGMVGAAMAASLGNNPLFEGKRIALLEGSPKKSFNNLPSNYSSRTCALSPSTVKLLSSIGAWDLITDMRCQEVKRMQVWDSMSDSEIAFNQKDLMDNLAYIVENDVILAALIKSVETMKDVEIRYESKVSKYSLPHPTSSLVDSTIGQFAEIELENGSKLTTRLVIGADGFRSLLRKSADIHSVEWDYNQFGVVAVLNLSETPENNVAWQRFLKTGPIAMLPLSSNHSCLIWTTSPGDAKNLLEMSDESFADAVNNAFWSDEAKDSVAQYVSKAFDDLLSTVGFTSSKTRQLPPTVVGITEGTRAKFPLGLCHASQYVKSRVALIGDAAHRVHPLAGQGVNLGFGDVECLTDNLGKAVSNGMDIGSLNALLDYETERQRAVLPVMFTTDSLNRLYGTNFLPFVLARTIGLQATNACSPIKDRLMEKAMG